MLQKTPKTQSDEETLLRIRRAEELEAERKDINDAIKAVYDEDPHPKALRIIVKLRKASPEEERDTLKWAAKYSDLANRI